MQLIIIQLNGKLIMRKVSWILFKIIILFYLFEKARFYHYAEPRNIERGKKIVINPPRYDVQLLNMLLSK